MSAMSVSLRPERIFRKRDTRPTSFTWPPRIQNACGGAGVVASRPGFLGPRYPAPLADDKSTNRRRHLAARATVCPVPPLDCARAKLAADDGRRGLRTAGRPRGAAVMGRIEKTVFISYRRTSVSWALNIYQHLTQHGYDVFFDFQGIASGDFETVILENVRARAHFLILLTPSALERCSEPGDWVRREIETALDTKRNIVPLMFEGFDFDAPAIAPHLTGKLAVLKKYNALSVPAEYFFAAMDSLRTKHLNVALDAVPHPISSAARQATAEQQAAAAAAPPVQKEELSAEQWFERGFGAIDPEEKIRCYTEAIRLKPDFAEAYSNRGDLSRDKGDRDGALTDYTEAVRLKPDYA